MVDSLPRHALISKLRLPTNPVFVGNRSSEVASDPQSSTKLAASNSKQLSDAKIFYGIESLDLSTLGQLEVKQAALLVHKFLPIEFCRYYQLLPFQMQQSSDQLSKLMVALVDPNNLEAVDALRRLLGHKKLRFELRVFLKSDYQQLLELLLVELKRLDVKAKNQALVDVKSELEVLVESIEVITENLPTDLSQVADSPDDAPAIKLVNKIMLKALQFSCSDIHVEPQENDIRIRFRRDGVLTRAFAPLPCKVGSVVAARFKILANLDISEQRLPQDGKLRQMYEGRQIDFRVSTLPSRYGEKVVLRVLDNSNTKLGLDKLIGDPDVLKIVQGMVSRPYGLFLVTGPTGSGKTTSLYSALAELDTEELNICTVEDPIEYSLPGLTQVQVNRGKGLDFAMILRAFLRQDPDVILVGETRDPETAKTAAAAALTGHLVLTTLHTNDSAGAITRLVELGVEPFNISSSLIGVLAQRLVRRLCPDCRAPYQPTSLELASFGCTDWAGNTIYQAVVGTEESCSTCNGFGYKDRCGVYEVMRFSERLQNLVFEGATTQKLKAAAVEQGMKTMLVYALNLVASGQTTLSEVRRVILSDLEI